MKKLSVLIAFIAFVGLSLVNAQTRAITGTVTSAEDGMGIPGVNVVVKGTTIGVATDFDGKYTIKVPEDATVLVFSAMGFKDKEVAIKGNSLNVVLDPENIALDEVVVTAASIKREKKSLGYAVTTVGGEDITKSKSNPIGALTGKVAGVQVSTTSGDVGGSNRVVIRGVSSLGGSNQPLYVVDGVPILNDMFSGRGDGSIAGVDNGNRASDINPDDIETITVLKGGAAAALYGSRARDGAIIITTKRAKQSKSKKYFTYSGGLSFGNPLVLPDYQNDYAPGYNSGKFANDRNNGWGPKISTLDGLKFKTVNGDSTYVKAHPDNVKDFFQSAVNISNSLAIADANEESDYRLGYSNVQNEGMIPDSWQKKNTVTVNTGKKMGKFSSRVSFSYINDRKNNLGKSGVADLVTGIARTTNLEDFKDYEDEQGNQKKLTDLINNPYWSLNKNTYSTKMDRVLGNVQLSYKPLEWMEFTGRVGTDFYREFRHNITAKGTLGAVNGNLYDNTYWSRSFNSDLMMTVDRDINSDINLKAILGHNVNQRDYFRMSNEASEFIVDDFYGYGNAGKNSPTKYSSTRRLWGAFLDLTLSYKGYLFLNATARVDNSSTLPEDTNTYFYPSVSGSVILTDMFPSLQNNVLNFLKIRGNWASVGSDEAAYQLNFTYTASETIFTQYTGSNKYPHGDYRAFSGPGTLPPFGLKPQRQNSWEIGTDIYLLDNRVSFDFAYYENVTKDQIIAVQVPNSTGYYRKKVNVAEIKNSGIELLMNVVPVLTDDFKWEITANYTTNTNKVVDLAEGIKVYDSGNAYNGVQIKAEKGGSFGIYGKYIERDPSGNPIVNAKTGLFQISSDVKNLGDIDPDFIYGITNSLKYKNLRFSFSLDGRVGGYFFSNTVGSLRRNGLVSETTKNRDGSIVNEGVNKIDNGDGTFSYVKNTTSVNTMREWWDNYYNSNLAETKVFENTWLKLRNINISYTIPTKWLGKTPFGMAEVGVYATNVAILYSKVPHIDPEASSLGAASNGQGIEWGGIPTARTIGGSLRLTF